MSGWLGDRHWQMLSARMDKEFADRRDLLASGSADSFDDYRYRVGYLSCLKDIARWSDEIIKSMDARPPSARTA